MNIRDVIAGLNLDNSPDTNDTGDGLYTEDTVGESVSPGEVLYLKSDGKYWKADADAGTTMPCKVMVMEPISADAPGQLLHNGYFRHDSWNWSIGNGENNLLYTDTTAGSISQTAPSGSGDQVQVVGYAVTSDIVFFNPTYVLVEVA